MGNDICCEELGTGTRQFQYVSITKYSEKLKPPPLLQPVQATLNRQKPFEYQLSPKPKLRKYGDEVYEGELDLIDRPQGYGKMYYKNGSLFIGQFKTGIASGKGFFIKKDGSFYRGNFRKNEAYDEDGYFWSESYEYEGMVEKNKPHGEGSEKSQQISFKGLYQNGRKVCGVMKWKTQDNQFQYKGCFDDEGLFHGKGELKQKRGVYKGDFEHGLKQGMGEFTTQKAKYQGQYKNNMKQGTGKFTNLLTGNVTYEGQFKNNLPHGKGKAPGKNGKIRQKQFIEGIDAEFIE